MSGVTGRSRAPRPFTKRWAKTIGSHVAALAWSPDRSVLAAAAVDGPIVLFDVATGEVLQNLTGHSFATTSLSWRPGDKSTLASAGQDGKVRLWKLVDDKPTSIDLAAGASWAERVAWSADGEILASAAGKKLRLWSPTGELLREYPDHPSTILDIGWKPGGNTLASAAYGKLQLWLPDRGEPIQSFEWKGSMLVLAWSPNGKYIATGDQDRTVHFWMTETGEDLMMSGYPAKVREISWDAASRFLATGGGDMPCVWDCSGRGPEGTAPLQFQGHQEMISALAFQHRGPYLVSGDRAGMLILWQPGGAKSALLRSHLSTPVVQLVWADDDKHLAVGSDSGDVVLYTLPTM